MSTLSTFWSNSSYHVLGRNVFITGATGYLGLVLIYKLLMYCPDIGSLYLLIRKKKGAAPGERLRELKEHFLLQKIERAIPGQLDKVFIVQGDSGERGG